MSHFDVIGIDVNVVDLLLCILIKKKSKKFKTSPLDFLKV